MKRIWCYLFVFCLIIPAKAQLTLESCQEKSRDNYPITTWQMSKKEIFRKSLYREKPVTKVM